LVKRSEAGFTPGYINFTGPVVNIYEQKYRWKLWLVVVAAMIVGASLWYTNRLAHRIGSEEKQKVRLWAEATQNKARLLRITTQLFDRLAHEEKQKVILWANATKRLIESPEIDYFAFAVVQNNETVPVILADDQGHIIASRNVDSALIQGQDSMTVELLEAFSAYKPIKVESQGWTNLIYYKDSRLFTDLKQTLNDLINSFISEIVLNSASVPVIYTDEQKNIIAWGNLDSTRVDDPDYMRDMLESMESENDPIPILLGEGRTHYAYYQHSFLLKQLRYYPFVQFGIIGLFLLIAYYAFSTARRIEQNQVWVGMAKETAHQLGTPISSLAGWMEILKSGKAGPGLLAEMEKDMSRLEMITERFSKIGSAPDLEMHNLTELVRESLEYFRKRTPREVSFHLDLPDGEEVMAPVSPPLLKWVIENLVKNGLDAMEGKGEIRIRVSRKDHQAVIDVADTGKGIPRGRQKTIFQPGFSTKPRGWGLGLSLCRRIIKDYHSGRIFVENSAPGKGTTFRIVLPVP